MKKLSIILLLSFCTTFIFAQSVNENCITCDSNMVDFTKGASAIGSKNISSGINSLAAGYLNGAIGDNSIAMGKKATAIGNRSIALGLSSEANGRSSLALGPYTKTSDSALVSAAFGSRVTAAVQRSMAIGFGLPDNPIENNISNSLMVGFNSDRPTFFVSPASGVGTSGKIGIGDVTNPSAKLHIRADETEDAIIKLETTGANQIAQLILADDENTITSISGGNMVFHANETGNFNFNNGKVGIGLNAPETKLDVDGTLKSTGFKLVDGTEAYGRMLQSDDQGNATWVDAPGSGCVQCSGGEASGEFASIVGENNFAEGRGSFAGGLDSYALGNQSFAFGDSAIASGNYSVAMGYDCHATELYSFAFGKNSFAGERYAFAMGKYSEALKTASFAIGTYLKANNDNSIVMGKGYSYSSRLENNLMNTLMIGFNSKLPTFFIGSSPGNLKTGKIGIGNITDPLAKLHILGDNDASLPDNASLYIQSAGNYYSTIWLGDKNHYIKTKPDHDLKFNADGQDFLFESGNMGIGTDDPQAKVQVKDGDIFIEDIDRGIIMKSPDGNCWRGTVNNQGQMQFTQIDCQTLETGITNPKPSHAEHVKIYPNPAGNRVIVAIDAMQNAIQLKITTIDGKLLHTETLNNPESYVDLTGYQSGAYVFSLYDKNNRLIENKKIIKE